MFPNFAERLTMNCLLLHMYSHIWIRAKKEPSWEHLLPISFNTVLLSGGVAAGSLTNVSTKYRRALWELRTRLLHILIVGYFRRMCSSYSYKEFAKPLIETYKPRNSRNHCNLRNNNEFIQPRVRSVNNGSESVRFKGPQLWQTLPPTIRNSESLYQFKTKIKIGTEKIVDAGYAAHLFPTWAFCDAHF